MFDLLFTINPEIVIEKVNLVEKERSIEKKREEGDLVVIKKELLNEIKDVSYHPSKLDAFIFV